MYRTTRLTGLATIVAVALGGCAPVRVNSYRDRVADFTRYHTYAWAVAEARTTGDPRLDNNRFFSQRIEEAVNMQLTARGFEQSGPGAADLLVRVHARMEQRLEAGAIDREYRQCRIEDCGPQIYDTGTLMVDLVDRRTNRLAWRGWAERSFDGVVDDQRWMEATIDQTVARILARLPRNPS
jgi:hypothetical protein